MSRYPLWHFGVPLSQASQYVGILDVALGMIGTFIISADAAYNLRRQYDYDYQYRIISLRLDPWLSVLLISAFLTQVIMGIALYHGAGTKKKNLVQLWMYVTPLMFIAIPIRVYQLMIVLEFYQELEEEQREDKQITEKPSSPPQNPQGPVPPPPYTQQGGNYPKLENVEVGSNSNSGGGEGGIGVGVTGQQSTTQQSWWNSGTSGPTQPVPPTVQRPSLSGFQDGVDG